MNRLSWPATWTILALAAATPACEKHCPPGYDKRDGTCYLIKDGGAEVLETEIDGGGSEERDDASDARFANDGDGGAETPEQDAGEGREGDVPARADVPQIYGAASMAPGRELWTWTVPEGTEYFELLIDDVAPASGGRQQESRFSASLELGDHTLKVRACRAGKHCSPWAVHTTRVESFGSDLPRGLRDSARAMRATALGHRVAIGCNDCADGPNSEVYSLEQAAASIERAIDRGADIIELNVANIAGVLYVSPADGSVVGARPALADLLQREKIAASDALVAIEVVETISGTQGDSTPETMAESLFTVIDAAPRVARNGRPLLVRTSYANRGYLEALAVESAGHASTGPYVRLMVSDPGRDPVTFYGATNAALIPDLEVVDAVSVDFRLSNLPFRLERIRAAGAAVIIEGVPGPGHGEIVLGALREQADAFIAEYRVDQARRIVARPDTGAAFGSKDISADGRVLKLTGVRNGNVRVAVEN